MILSQAKDDFLNNKEVYGRSLETIRGYRTVLDYFEEFTAVKYNGPVYLDDLTCKDLDGFVYFMKAEKGWKPNSIKKCHYTLSSFFGYCTRKELCVKDISKNMEPLKGERKEREYLTHPEVQALLGAIQHPIIKVAAMAIYYTGMRISECLKLELEDVDLAKGLVHIRDSKNREERKIPIHQNLKGPLKEYLEKKRPQVSSKSFFALPGTGKVSAVYFNLILRRARQELGMHKVSAHTLRHSFASGLVNKGISLVHIQKLLGHADLRTTSVYTHASLKEITESVNQLD